MIRLIQLKSDKRGRAVALVQDPSLRFLQDIDSIYRLALAALAEAQSLEQFAQARVSKEVVDYDTVHRGDSEWRVLPAFDHPEEPACCLVTGTGLTHKASAENRQAMHAEQKPTVLTDSMRMYQWGLQGGRPSHGQIGTPPEWFYKGCGTVLRGHGEPLEVPSFGLDGGEEAEVAGAYLIDPSGTPRRVGLTLANEFSDHQIEQKNYLYLAPSKLRTCAIGPELIVNGEFSDSHGLVRIHRKEKILWSKPFSTGEKNMSHTVANLEHHHFKYEAHRRPGAVHIHFFGADVFSFGDNVQLADGDEMEIELAGFGRSLRNPVRIDRSAEKFVTVPPV